MKLWVFVPLILFVFISWGNIRSVQTQTLDQLSSILKQFNTTQKLALLIDILSKQPVLFDKLEHLFLGAIPLISEMGHIKPQIYQHMLPWILDNLPYALKSKLVLNVTHDIVDEINHVNITGLDPSNGSVFMDGFIERLDLLHTGMRAVDKILEPIFISNGLNPKYFDFTIPKAIAFLEKFLKDYGVEVLGTMIKEINSVNTSEIANNDTRALEIKFWKQFSLLHLGGSVLQAVLTPVEEHLPQPQTGPLRDQCYSDVMTFLNNLFQGSKWAVEMFDAAGKPPTGTLTGNLHFIGSYDQCLGITPNFTGAGDLRTTATKYCRATFDIPDNLMASIKALIGDVNTFGVPITLTWGLCLPASCQEGDVSELFKLGFLKTLNLTPSVECSRSFGIEDKGTIIIIVILGAIVLVCLMATLFHVYRFSDDEEDEELTTFTLPLPKAYERKKDNPDIDETNFSTEKRNSHVTRNGHLTTMDNENDSMDSLVSDEKYKGFMEKLTKAFSLYQNIPDVMSFDQPKDSIQCVYGIRFFSLAWIVLGNSFLYAALSLTKAPVTGNLLEGVGLLKNFAFQAVYTAPFAIDSFFVISGFLITYHFLRKCLHKGKLKWQFILGFYSNRYIRITPVYFIILMTYTYFYHYVGDSPLYPNSIAVADKCKDNWWRHILYVNNLVGTSGTLAFEQCMPWSWFLACIMQFYLITPILIIFYLWSSVLGGFMVCLLLIASVVATAIKEKKYTGDILSMMSDGGDYWNNVFITPWCRVGAYCIGILLGFLFDNCDFKKKVKIHKDLSLLAWLAALGVFITLTYSPYTKNREGGYTWTPIQSEVYEAMSHVVWALALSWVIFACATEHGGIVNWFLSWRGFLPLSRLSYVVYLIHPVIMVAFVYNKKVLVYMNSFEMVYMFLGHLITSYVIGVLFAVGIELPFVRLLQVFKSRGCISKVGT
ncbi:nose resistant to fluoxetine protein 6-like isoform X1 [Ostrea edulis]|uniref:nose resistant to fluoxetine protein 6-like isoform X1 n=1 Tax=Ostrea edulis TaxID=37623 RepID=UPI00209580CA|nr:nose resistant to fluoxetine protein 6-like isoform X1 [Ostrea edulis]